MLGHQPCPKGAGPQLPSKFLVSLLTHKRSDVATKFDVLTHGAVACLWGKHTLS